MSVHEQIDGLISKRKLNSKLKEKIDGFVEFLGTKLSALKELPPQNLDDLSILEGVKVPINDKSFNLNASFLFKPPELHKVGSYTLNCLVKNEDNNFVIDLALEIPRECWQKKDPLNYVYHRKRAFYLAYIAKHLQSFKNIVSSVQFAFFHGDHLKPILVVTPAGKLQSLCRFNILPFPAQDKSFVLQKFLPDKCNIQSALFDATLPLSSSPVYNSSVLRDLTLHDFSKILKNHLSDHQNVQDALVLVRIWLEQRGLRNNFSHILTAFVCYLLTKRSINPNLSAFQVFRAILQNLSTSSWDSIGVVFNSTNEDNVDEEELCAEYRSHFAVVFVDVHTKLNLCHSITIDLYERLKYDATISLGQMNNIKVDVHSLFSSRVDFHLYFDYYINVSTDCIKHDFLNNESSFLDTGFNAIHILCSRLIRLINLAVGERLMLVQHKEYAVFDNWNITSPPPYKSTSVQFFTLGLLVNVEKAFEAITKGPLANRTEEAAAFRDLWGEKSEIRRFQNGDIREAVYWNSNSQQEKRNILLQAIKYILNRKLHCKVKLIASTVGYMDSLLELGSIKFDDDKTVYGTGEHFLQLINQNMVTLKKYLHNLSGLSFSVVDVVGIDPVLRSTEVFPAFPMNSKPKNVQNFCNLFSIGDFDDKIKHIRPIELVLKIEADTKLLSNIQAIENQKYLFYYELGKVMAKSHNIFVRPTSSHLDLFLNGHVFRVYLAITKEAAIYRDLANKAKAVKSVDCAEADEIEFRTQGLPAISSCLNSLSKENPSFALSCRLFKRWLSLQLMKHFFNDITLDLLVAYAYLYFEAHYPIPTSPVKGFVRVLKFIADFDFTQNPLILNFNQSFSIDKVSDIKDNFATERPRLPVIFIVTPYDRKLSHHTRFTPSALIVYHVKKLAHTLLDKMTSDFIQFKLPDIKNHLKPNWAMFDAIIKLNTKPILNKYQAIDFPANICIKQTLYSPEHKHVMPITDFNPVGIYLNSLKKAFRNQALFFYDEFGGRQIGVLLKPDALDTKPFKYSTVEGSSLTGTSYSHSIDNVALNLSAIMEDLQILGEGLVEKVILQSDKLLARKQ